MTMSLLPPESTVNGQPTVALEPPTASLIGLLNIFLQRIRLFVLLPLVLMVAGGLYVYTRPPSYSALALLRPEGSSGGMSQLAGLAAQFGMNVPGGDARSLSVDTYAELLMAPDYLRQVAQTEFVLPNGTKTNLIRYFKIDPRLPLRAQLERAESALRGSMAVGTSPAAGLVHVSTTADSPEMAEAMNQVLVRTLESRTEALRRLRAQGEREFIDSQLRDAQEDLSRAENALKDFQLRNRVIASPSLIVEQTRLERQAQLRQTLYLSLAQGLEQARVNELRSGPVLSIVGSPLGTARRNGRNLLLVLVASLFFGTFAAAALALIGHYWERHHSGDTPEYREFRRLRERIPRLLAFGARRAP